MEPELSFKYSDKEFPYLEYYNKYGKLPLNPPNNIDWVDGIIEYKTKIEFGQKKFSDREFYIKKLELAELAISWLNETLSSEQSRLHKDPHLKQFTRNYNQILIGMEDNRIALLNVLEKKFNYYKPNGSGKLNWNGNKNVLIDIFRQLKKCKTPAGELVLSNSNTEVALFLKNGFICFERTKISTIEGVLKKIDRPSISKRIDINCKDH